ncbi:phosphonoacetaldehyde hydrolase [Pseudogracilibacillus sp. SO10305]|uniref:phosphonoacetaldehyde hydrolase n=1 Tax=Pseudogracilibacillus sp. SO10305 TaxID=3098292 RepID=UPI00300E5614
MSKTCVIFDWAGTTVDFGSCAPVEVFLTIFEEARVPVTFEEARKPMGMLKVEHIRTMLEMPRIQSAWEEVHGALPKEADVVRLYESFEGQLFNTLRQFTTPISGVVEAVHALRANGVKIGSTTGYTREMIDIVKVDAAEKGYAPDCIVTADEVSGHGRPAPFMIYENMKSLDVADVRNVVKVGDTKADIEEGLHAGAYTIGVIVGSSEMGLTEAEFAKLNEEEKRAKIAEVREQFLSYGADATIETMAELPKLVRELV